MFLRIHKRSTEIYKSNCLHVSPLKYSRACYCLIGHHKDKLTPYLINGCNHSKSKVRAGYLSLQSTYRKESCFFSFDLLVIHMRIVLHSKDIDRHLISTTMA